ncbi:MAG: chemotaxis protein CheD [Gorillibacterium sp.]|nr:chemotaxis protein CheD [Gorillibacterium sp.]
MTEQVLIKVGMADLNVASKEGILKTIGLGSCVGLTLYDPVFKIAGMAHVMLPSSEIAKEGPLNRAKYADTAIPELILQMVQLGAAVSRMQSKMAGGAQMFAFSTAKDTMRIGPRNTESCKEMLKKLGIPLLGEDTGGSYGRTIEIDCSTGNLSITSIQMGSKVL